MHKANEKIVDAKEVKINGQIDLNNYSETKTSLDRDEKLIKWDKLESDLQAVSEYRKDTVKGVIQLKKNGKWTALTDYRRNSIVRQLRAKGNKHATPEAVDQLLNSDFTPEVNPIQEFFLSITWDKIDRIGQLSETVTTDKPEFFQNMLRKWLTGTVANVFEDFCANHLVLIFVGYFDQGQGKSKWFLRLVPDALKDYYYEGEIDPDNKDHQLETTQNFIVNFDDWFASITKNKINELKGFITKNKVTVRRPYARYSEELPKIASFCGGSNDQAFLYDTTGNRRFVPINISAVNLDAQSKIDLVQLWAQAYYHFKEGYRYWIDREEQRELEKHNDQFLVTFQEYEILTRFFVKASPGSSDTLYYTATELNSYFEGQGYRRFSLKKLGEACKKAGFERVKRRRPGGQSLWMYELQINQAPDATEAADDDEKQTIEEPTDAVSILREAEGRVVTQQDNCKNDKLPF